MSMPKPEYHLLQEFSDGTTSEPQIVPLSEVPSSVQVSRRQLVGGLGIGALLALVVGCGRSKRPEEDASGSTSPQQGTNPERNLAQGHSERSRRKEETPAEEQRYHEQVSEPDLQPEPNEQTELDPRAKDQLVQDLGPEPREQAKLDDRAKDQLVADLGPEPEDPPPTKVEPTTPEATAEKGASPRLDSPPAPRPSPRRAPSRRSYSPPRGTYRGSYCSCNQVCTCIPVYYPSDRAKKEEFSEIDKREILDKLMELPVESWRYKEEVPSVRHVGPTAQAFRSAFGLGNNDQQISCVDADGIAFAAIQALFALLQAREAQLASQEKKTAELRGEIVRLCQMNESLSNRLESVEERLVEVQ